MNPPRDLIFRFFEVPFTPYRYLNGIALTFTMLSLYNVRKKIKASRILFLFLLPDRPTGQLNIRVSNWLVKNASSRQSTENVEQKLFLKHVVYTCSDPSQVAYQPVLLMLLPEAESLVFLWNSSVSMTSQNRKGEVLSQ